MKKIKNVTLVTHKNYLQNKEIKKLCSFLSRESITLTTIAVDKNYDYKDSIVKRSDLMIVLGGDGLFLTASKIAYKFSIPILGVNFGKIGFLVDVDKKDVLKKIKDILRGNFLLDKRLLINGVVTTNSSKQVSSHALNDIVIHNFGLLKMIEVKIFVNDYLINTERSDGIIIATPTGSTAYSMSNGCPIVSPNSNIISIVPVAPHTYSHRPIIINSNDKIEIFVSKKSIKHSLVTFDGHSNLSIAEPCKIKIKKSNKYLEIVHPKDYNYFEILNKKLKWGRKP